MNKFEMILFSVLAVTAAISTFDWVVFVFKRAPRNSCVPRHFWILGFLSAIALVYCFLNGMKFL